MDQGVQDLLSGEGLYRNSVVTTPAVPYVTWDSAKRRRRALGSVIESLGDDDRTE